MKLLLLLPLLLGLPTPLFAGSTNNSTSGYKWENSCESDNYYGLWKKEDSNSKKWGVYKCAYEANCGVTYEGKWLSKGVSYDDANDQYETLCSR